MTAVEIKLITDALIAISAGISTLTYIGALIVVALIFISIDIMRK